MEVWNVANTSNLEWENTNKIITVFCRFENAIWMLDFSRRFSISCLEKDLDNMYFFYAGYYHIS